MTSMLCLFRRKIPAPWRSHWRDALAIVTWFVDLGRRRGKHSRNIFNSMFLASALPESRTGTIATARTKGTPGNYAEWVELYETLGPADRDGIASRTRLVRQTAADIHSFAGLQSRYRSSPCRSRFGEAANLRRVGIVHRG